MRRILVISLALLVIVVLAVASLAFIFPYFNINPQKQSPDFHVGVTFGGNTTQEAKLLVDRVKNFTNLFVVQSGPVSVNETALNEIVDYAVGANLDVIVYFGFFNPQDPWQVPWLDYAKAQWGSKFLGVYLNDEPGGSEIDANWAGYFNQIKMRNSSEYLMHVPSIELAINGSLPVDNDLAAEHFVSFVQTGIGLQELKSRSIHSFTSDYALYWFDYLGGYDTVFAEFGSNQSITQAIALARGAAQMQNKTWGAIVTWKYDQPPYLDSGNEIYDELMAAYMSGAKYAVIFNYPTIPGNPYGVLTEEHFKALEKLWSNIQVLKPNPSEDAVLVLPRNYGWGMRRVDDMLWGIWGPDNKSSQVWNVTQKLLTQYGLGLDIVYDDSRFPVAGRYSQIFYWNQTNAG